MTAPRSVGGGGRDPIGAPTRAQALAFDSIVHVNEKGGCFGGTEEYIALLASELSHHGVRSDLVCGVVTGAFSPDLGAVRVVPGLASRDPQPDTSADVAGSVASLDPDVIYVHNIFDPGVVAALAGIDGRGPLIWYVHDHYLTCLSELRWRRDVGSCPAALGEGCLAAISESRCVLRYPDHPLGPAQLDERIALSRALGLADAIVVVSEYMRMRLVQAAPELASRIHLVPRPIRDLGPLQPRRRRHPSDHAVITFAGRITPEKGLAVVIEALAKVDGHAPVELRIAGIVEHEGYWSHCQQTQRAAMANNPRLTVTYMGHLDYPATDELFRHSDIVTIPSQWPEPLGAVAIEAMSAGAAVVASEIGGLATHLVHERNGLLVDPADAAAWSHAIESLVHDPHRARAFGVQAHHDVAAVTTARHLEVLNEIIARTRS